VVWCCQDIAYYESPPGLQLLHCVAFDEHVLGGESTVADGFAACEQLRRDVPEAFEALTRIPATFHKVGGFVCFVF
jgi:gamma-butyrobetaine dioxygenase